MFGHAFGIALAVALIFGGVDFVAKKPHPLIVGSITGFVSFCLNILIIFNGYPSFSYPLGGGYAGLVALGVMIGLIVIWVTDGISNDSEDGSLGGAVTGSCLCAVALFLWFVAQAWFMEPGWFYDNGGYKQMASLVNAKDAPGAYADTDLDHLIRVSPKTAMLDASTAIGGDADIGSYLKTNKPYLQKVAGRFYYIIDLVPTNWQSFQQRGGVVPAYIAVDAQDPSKSPEIHKGYKMAYVPGARWTNQLDRYVYLNFTVNSKWRVDDLDGGMEVDDNWNPYYIGTLLRNQISDKGRVPDGIVLVDPQSGKITQYSMEEVPGWIDRVYSEDWVKEYVGWWGNYFDHIDCPNCGTAGQRKIDDVHFVVTSQEGLMFQVTMTSKNSDQSLTEVIYIQPRTGDAVRYKITGRTLQGVQHLVEEVSKSGASGNAEGFNASSCQIHTLLGEQVWYCILTGKAGGRRESAGSYAGVALVQAKNTTSNNLVIIAKTLESAYDQLRFQIATQGNDSPTLAESVHKIQIKGIVDRKGTVAVAADKSFVYFTLKGPDVPQNVVFKADGSQIPAALMQVGDEVTVTALSVRYDGITDVTDLNDGSLPSYVK